MCFCLYSGTFILSPAMRPPTEFQSDLRLWLRSLRSHLRTFYGATQTSQLLSLLSLHGNLASGNVALVSGFLTFNWWRHSQTPTRLGWVVRWLCLYLVSLFVTAGPQPTRRRRLSWWMKKNPTRRSTTNYFRIDLPLMNMYLGHVWRQPRCWACRFATPTHREVRRLRDKLFARRFQPITATARIAYDIYEDYFQPVKN